MWQKKNEKEKESIPVFISVELDPFQPITYKNVVTSNLSTNSWVSVTVIIFPQMAVIHIFCSYLFKTESKAERVNGWLFYQLFFCFEILVCLYGH